MRALLDAVRLSVEQVQNNRYFFALGEIGNTGMYYEIFNPEINLYQKGDLTRYPAVLMRVEQSTIDRNTKRENFNIWLMVTDIIDQQRGAGIAEQQEAGKLVILEVLEHLKQYNFSATDSVLEFDYQTYQLPSFAQVTSCSINIVKLR